MCSCWVTANISCSRVGMAECTQAIATCSFCVGSRVQLPEHLSLRSFWDQRNELNESVCLPTELNPGPCKSEWHVLEPTLNPYEQYWEYSWCVLLKISYVSVIYQLRIHCTVLYRNFRLSLHKQEISTIPNIWRIREDTCLNIYPVDRIWHF